MLFLSGLKYNHSRHNVWCVTTLLISSWFQRTTLAVVTTNLVTVEKQQVLVDEPILHEQSPQSQHQENIGGNNLKPLEQLNLNRQLDNKKTTASTATVLRPLGKKIEGEPKNENHDETQQQTTNLQRMAESKSRSQTSADYALQFGPVKNVPYPPYADDSETRLLHRHSRRLLSYQELTTTITTTTTGGEGNTLFSSDQMVSGNGTSWERVYAYANLNWTTTASSSSNHRHRRRGRRLGLKDWDQTICPLVDHRVFPIDENGVSVGPKLCSKFLQPPYNDEMDQRCTSDVRDLDSYQLLLLEQQPQQENSTSRKGVRFYLPDPMDEHHHMNVVNDRERHSSSSGVVFMDAEHFAVCSFSHSMLYVYHLNPNTMEVTLLDKKFNRINGGWKSGEYTELVDYDGRELLATGNLRTASFSLFGFDWKTKKLHLIEGHFPYKDVMQMVHGVRFYPTSDDDSSSTRSIESHIMGVTVQFKKRPKSLAVRLYDWNLETIRAELLMSGTPYDWMGPQDLYFIDKYNLIVAYTKNKVARKLKRHENCREANSEMGSYLVHYRLDFDLDKDTTTRYNSTKFIELQSIFYPDSHPDSIGYNDGIVIMSDQYNDHVTFVAVDPTGRKPMEHIGILTGYHMNHGVAIAPSLEYIAVTMYGDNSVIINRFPDWLEEKIYQHRISHQNNNEKQSDDKNSKQKAGGPQKKRLRAAMKAAKARLVETLAEKVVEN